MSKKNLLVEKHPFPSTLTDLWVQYTWQIWLLKSTGTKTNVKIIYSWVIANYENFQGWRSVTSVGNMNVPMSAGKTARVEVLKAEFIGSGNDIKHYITELLEGKLLSEVQLADENVLVPSELNNIAFGIDKNDVNLKYVSRPEVMLPMEHLLIPWSSKSTPSPAGYSIFVSELFFLPKLDIFNVLPADVNDEKFVDIIKWVSEQLNLTTGLRFIKDSAPRLGNVEWFRLPAADAELRPLVQYRVIKNGNGVAKQIQAFLKPQNKGPKEVLVRCRIMNGEELALDEVKKGTWTNTELVFDFFSLQPVSEVQLTVWELESGSETARILFEDSNVLIRTISTTMSIVQSQINSGRINLLDKLDSREQNKPVELASFHRTARASIVNSGGYKHDPWVSSSREIIDFMKKIYPEPSGAKFFINGWDEKLNASGQLSFFQWIMEIVNTPESGSLLLIDPFFDKDGIEIFANAQTSNKKFRVLTCTQHRVKSKSKRTSGVLTDPAKKIQANCRAWAPLFTGINITITDLTSPDGGKKQLFHDRYIIVTDDKGFATKGYHLSNSLQGATRKEPILITLIPPDVLPEVLKYMGDLLDATKVGTSKKTTLVTLFQVPETSKVISTSAALNNPNFNKSLQEIPQAAYLFANLYNESRLRKANLAELQTFVQDQGLFADDSSSLELYKINPSQISHFAKILNKASQRKFNKLMLSFGQAMARSIYYSTDYNVVNELQKNLKQKPTIAEKLVAFVLDIKPKKNPNNRYKHYLIYIDGNFEGIFHATHSQINYMGGDFFGVPYDCYYACKILVKGLPKTAVKLLERLINQAAAGGWNEADVNLTGIMLLISTINHLFLRYYTVAERHIQTEFLSSSDYKIRAAASAGLLMGVTSSYHHQEFDDVNQLLKNTLPDDEYRLAISSIAHNVRLNRALPQEELMTKLYAALIANWSGETNLMERIIQVLSGPLKYSYSYSISEYFLNPLIATRYIDHQWVFGFWNKLFTNKLSYHEYLKKKTDHYSEHTDAELTKTISYYFTKLSAEEQITIVDDWIRSIAPFWAYLSQPFQQQINFYIYDGAAERAYWIKVLFEHMKETRLLLPEPLNLINQFLKQYELEIAKAEKYVTSRGYSPISSLKQSL
ncbi:VPA1262 family protein [Mucilaginibacter sp.]|uniref:VPA1262 family protein n=1 Tax=Mucilaginibacter sp. TaxID=1882438 RepID=UPI0032671AA2